MSLCFSPGDEGDDGGHPGPLLILLLVLLVLLAAPVRLGADVSVYDLVHCSKHTIRKSGDWIQRKVITKEMWNWSK